MCVCVCFACVCVCVYVLGVFAIFRAGGDSCCVCFYVYVCVWGVSLWLQQLSPPLIIAHYSALFPPNIQRR